MVRKSKYTELIKQVEMLEDQLRSLQNVKPEKVTDEIDYRSLVEHANEAILVAQNGLLTFANPKAERLFGYSQKELIPKPIRDFIHEQDQASVMDFHERRLRGEDVPKKYSFRLLDRHGDTRWVEIKVERFLWRGQPAALCFLSDIRERKWIEEKYRHVLDSTSEGFILLDAQRNIIDVNKTLLKISGYQPVQMMGKQVDWFYVKSTVDFYFADKEHLSFEAQFRSKNGRTIPMLFNRSILSDEQGETAGYMYFLTDMTELKAIQEERRKAEKQYRNIYRNAVQGIFQSRLSGELIRVNPAYAHMLGYKSPGEIIAIKEGAVKFYHHPQDRDKLIRAVRKRGYVANYELKLKRKDEKTLWVLANIRLINTDKGDPILEGILVDNTKKKILETKLRRGREKFRSLSVRDNLTGLHNTRYLYKMLDQLSENSKA